MREFLQGSQHVGSSVYDSNETLLGTVGRIYVDDSAGEPIFVVIDCGLLGIRQVAAPLAGASAGPGRVTLAFTAQQVRSAPHIEESRIMSEPDERDLRKHFGL